MNTVYRTAPTTTKIEAPRASLLRRLRARLFSNITHRLEMRQTWLALPAEVRRVLREAGLRRRLLKLASPRLLTEATEQVVEAVRYERAVVAWERSGWIDDVLDGKTEGCRSPPSFPDPTALSMGPSSSREPSDMQRTEQATATSVKGAVEALDEGLLHYVVMQVIRGR